MVRYADDFVVFCETRDDAQEVIGHPERLARSTGLALSTEKTQIVHLTEGFNFLGFNVRHYAAPQTTASGYKLLIKPSPNRSPGIRSDRPSDLVCTQRPPVGDVIRTLNPIIRGQANYYRIGVASETFCALDNWMFHRPSAG